MAARHTDFVLRRRELIKLLRHALKLGPHPLELLPRKRLVRGLRVESVAHCLDIAYHPVNIYWGLLSSSWSGYCHKNFTFCLSYAIFIIDRSVGQCHSITQITFEAKIF
jgi:hypothetical protein